MEGVPEKSRLDEIERNGGALSSGRARGRARSLSDIGSCSILCCQIWRHEMAQLQDVVAYQPGLRNVGQAPRVRSTPAWCRFGGCHSHPWLLLPAERLGW